MSTRPDPVVAARRCRSDGELDGAWVIIDRRRGSAGGVDLALDLGDGHGADHVDEEAVLIVAGGESGGAGIVGAGDVADGAGVLRRRQIGSGRSWRNRWSWR